MRGEGRHLLALHGFGSSYKSFYYQTEYFAAHGFKVFAPDFPSFGSSQAAGAWSVGDYAQWLEKFCLKAGVEKPVILAHSFGARVAIKLLSGNCAFASALVITGGAGLVKPRSPRYIRRVKAYRRVKRLFPRFAEKHFGSEEYKSLSPQMKLSYKKIVNEDLSGAAQKITAPTLLIYGEEDGVTPLGEEGQTFHRLIGGSVLTSMRGGHFCFAEYPAEFNALVLKFLNSPDAGG